MKLAWGIMLALLLSTAAQAQRHDYHSGNNHDGDINSDVIVDMPPEVWTQGQNRSQNPPCMRCCVYENRSYTEGAVVKAEGVLLQCVRDEKLLGTNNLIWRIVK